MARLRDEFFDEYAVVTEGGPGTVVIKPSDLTPYSALALGVLAERAGIPAGVINIVTGLPTAIGDEIMGNEAVRKISFTGSKRVGSILMKGAAESVKRLSLELEGDAPFIVFDDCDLDLAVEGAVVRSFATAAKLACVPIAFWSSPGSTKPSRRSWHVVSTR